MKQIKSTMQKLFKELLLVMSFMPLILHASQSHELPDTLSRLPTIPLPIIGRPRQMNLEFILNSPNLNIEQSEESSISTPSLRKREKEQDTDTENNSNTRTVRIKVEHIKQPSEQSSNHYQALSTDLITQRDLENIPNRQQVTSLKIILGNKIKDRRKKPRNSYFTALNTRDISLLNQYFPNVVNLDLSDLNNLGSTALETLATSFTNLANLNLANTHIYDTGLNILLRSMFAPNLFSLNLHNTAITTASLSNLHMSQLNRLQSLDLSNNRLSTEQSSQLASYLQRAPFRNTLRFLNLRNIHISPEVVQKIRQELPETSKIDC